MPAVYFRLPFLAPETKYIDDRQPKNFHFIQRFFDRVKFGRRDDGKDQFHDKILVAYFRKSGMARISVFSRRRFVFIVGISVMTLTIFLCTMVFSLVPETRVLLGYSCPPIPGNRGGQPELRCTMRMGLARPLAVCLTAGLATLAFAGTSRANIIVNGSFESGMSVPNAIPGYRTLSGPTDPAGFGGTMDMTGWSVMNNNIDWIHNNYWQASSGTYSLDLSGWTPGGVQQTVSTVIGELYTLSFDVSVNPDLRHSATARRLDVYVRDSSLNEVLNNNVLIPRGTRTFQDMQWQTVTYQFVATDTMTTIQFVSSPSNIDAGGPALDNVSLVGNGQVNPIPAPPALILAGIGGLGFLATRRRKV